MSKTHKIIYWISTVWLALGMMSSGIVQFFNMKEEVAFILNLGYPAYFITFLGLSKIIGVVAILMPKYPLLKEWAYAGFFFTMTGALYSHIIIGQTTFAELFPPVLLMILIIFSWYFRPASRKISNV